MGMTMTEKILARAGGRDRVQPGEYVTARVDRMMVHEAFARCALDLMKLGITELHDPSKVVIILDHYFPAPTVRMAEGHNLIRQAADRFGIENYMGHAGICHQVMVENGHAVPGFLILGTDSHTTTYGAFGAASAGIGQTEMNYVLVTGELWLRVPATIGFSLEGASPAGLMAKDIILHIAGTWGTEVAQYRAVEISGPAAERMSLAGRLTLSNMGVEIGAKFAMFAADEKTVKYVAPRTDETVATFGPDEDAVYEAIYRVDVSPLEPQVGCPHNPGNVKSVSAVGNVPVQQAFLGSCTNGRLEDLEVAAKILTGRRVHPRTRLLVAPASQNAILEATRLGYTQTLMEAGAHILPTGCGPCPGGHMGLLASNENCISSTNRNFTGRMGSEQSFVYLASPATVAASAIEGRIADPRNYWSETTV